MFVSLSLIGWKAFLPLWGAEAHLRTALVEPGADEGDVHGTARAPGALAEGVRRPQQPDALRGALRVQRRLLQERAHACTSTRMP